MTIFGQVIDPSIAFFLVTALGLALSFEFVNGFHDTANAVATVIYTRTLRPNVAVAWSGVWNLIGVMTSTGAVAFGIVSLLPSELVLHVGSIAGFAMVFSLLMSAMIWNVGTWYFGIPASSSHALVGSIMGVGLANSMLSANHRLGEGVNWSKAYEVGAALLLSPAVGFIGAALLLFAAKKLIRQKDLYSRPEPNAAPPRMIRALLILTCTAVSFGHGSNDGQKGMGLIMLILIGILPSAYAVNLGTGPAALDQLATTANTVAVQMDHHRGGSVIEDSKRASDELSTFLQSEGPATGTTYAAVVFKSQEISYLLNGCSTLSRLHPENRRLLRSDLYLTAQTLGKLAKSNEITDPDELGTADRLQNGTERVTQFIPWWVKVAVALSLGLGTTIGWKRIVVTVGEKIGKEHLTCGQGAAAELIAAATIFAADRFGLPVSTTHVLSSGVAGTMAANNSGLQTRTLRNLLLAWVLTLPVTVLLGAGIFAFVLNVLLSFRIR